MTECLCCARKTDLFLCSSCQGELRRQLADLPWWMERLAESALGQTKLGDGGRRIRTDESPIRFNDKSSTLYADIHNTLVCWARGICENRGLDVPQLRTSADLCGWLSTNISAIAAQEDADRCLIDVRDATTRIERAVNRPVPPRLCGPCPTVVEHHRECGNQLYARRDVIEVTCKTCRQTYRVEDLVIRLINQTAYMAFTIPELANVILPRLQERIPQRTLQDWHANGRMKPSGYRRSRGKTYPQFRLDEVRRAALSTKSTCPRVS